MSKQAKKPKPLTMPIGSMVVRTPKQEREARIASEWTDHNNRVWRAVIAGNKPKSALQFEDEGGELKRVGWPDGYDKAKDAHSKLFGGHTAKSVLAVPANKGGRPKGSGKKVDLRSYNGKKIHVLVKSNPKKAGSASAKRFDLYRNGMTVEAFIEAGGTPGDVAWDIGHGFIEVK